MGYSDFSETFYAAAADVPDTPNVPRIDYQWSDSTSVFIEWDQLSDNLGNAGNLIIGYKLYMDDGMGGPFTVQYDTTPFSP